MTQTVTAASAFDGPGGNWRAGYAVAESIGYQFATEKAISAIGIEARSSGFQNQAPTSFVLEYWVGSAYQTALSITGATGWGAVQTRYFDATGGIAGPPSAPSSRTGSLLPVPLTLSHRVRQPVPVLSDLLEA